MKRTKLRELRKESDQQLHTRVDKIRADMFDVRFRREVDQVADLNVLRCHRRNLAAALTVLRERQIGIAGDKMAAANEGEKS